MSNKTTESIFEITRDDEKYYHEKLINIIGDSPKPISRKLWERAIYKEMPLIYASGSSKNFFMAYMIANKCKDDNKSFSIRGSGANLVVSYLLGISKTDYGNCKKAYPYQTCLGTENNPIKYHFEFCIGSENYRRELIDYVTDKFKLVSDRQHYLHHYKGNYIESDSMLILTPKNMDLTRFGAHYISNSKVSGIEYFKGLHVCSYASTVDLLVNSVQHDVDELTDELSLKGLGNLYGYFSEQPIFRIDYVEPFAKKYRIDLNNINSYEDIIDEVCRKYDTFRDGENELIINKESLWTYLNEHVDKKVLDKVYRIAVTPNKYSKLKLQSEYGLDKLLYFNEILNISYIVDVGTVTEIVETELVKSFLMTILKKEPKNQSGVC